jgi:hypothetical protein
MSAQADLLNSQHMGKQYNKVIKKRRRAAYMKRKRAAAHLAAPKAAKK